MDDRGIMDTVDGLRYLQLPKTILANRAVGMSLQLACCLSSQSD